MNKNRKGSHPYSSQFSHVCIVPPHETFSINRLRTGAAEILLKFKAITWYNEKVEKKVLKAKRKYYSFFYLSNSFSIIFLIFLFSKVFIFMPTPHRFLHVCFVPPHETIQRLVEYRCSWNIVKTLSCLRLHCTSQWDNPSAGRVQVQKKYWSIKLKAIKWHYEKKS